MGAERVVGREGFGDEVGLLRLHALIHMLAVVAVGPAVEAAVFHRGDVVGHEVVADLVALVHCRPQRLGRWLPGQAVRVAQARREHAVIARLHIHLPDRSAALFGCHAALGDVAVRAHGHIKLRPSRIGDQVLRPVVVDRAAGQGGELGAGRGDLRVASFVGEAEHGVGVGNKQGVADQGHAEWRVQAFEQR